MWLNHFEVKSSPNSKFYALRNGGTLSLYRDKVLLWKKDLDYKFQLLEVANIGTILLKDNIGNIRTFNIDGIESNVLPVEPEREIANAWISPDANLILYQEVSYKQLKKGFLKKTLINIATIRLITYNISTGSHIVFWEFVQDKEDKDIIFTLSKDKKYALVMENYPDKTLYSVLDIQDMENITKIYQKEVESARVLQGVIGKKAIFALDVVKNDLNFIVIISPFEGGKYSVTLPFSEYELLFILDKYILAKVGTKNFLAYNYRENKEVFNFDVRLYEEVGIKNFDITFNLEGDIITVYIQEGILLEFEYSEVETFNIQYKRLQTELYERKMKEREHELKKKKFKESLEKIKNRRIDLEEEDMVETDKKEESDSKRPIEDLDAKKKSLQQQYKKVKLLYSKLKKQYEDGKIDSHKYKIKKNSLVSKLKEIKEELDSLEKEEAKDLVVPVHKTDINKEELEAKRDKILAIIDKLEEKRIYGEVNEKQYEKLYKKYNNQLKEIEQLLAN